MSALEQVRGLLKPGIELYLIEEGIYSIEQSPTPQSFDRVAAVYDVLIRSKLYNRLMWGTSPASYRKFAQEAQQASHAVLLDAGCGSMAVTAEAHSGAKGIVVGIDSSLPMLQRAQTRLKALGATSTILILGDVKNIPFKSASFDGVLFMGMAHLFSDMTPVMSELRRVLTEDGGLYLTSLIKSERKFGNSFLEKLQARGEVNAIRSPQAVIDLLTPILPKVESTVEGNMLFANAK